MLLDTHYDYKNQAWVSDGVYQRCGHPDEMNCGCYGRTHEGEIKTPEIAESIT